jgi:hypothetical protein
VVGALLLGGIIAAPLAAFVVRALPARILITNMKTFLEAMGVSGGLASVIYVLIVVVWLAALVHSIIVNHRERKASLEVKVVSA